MANPYAAVGALLIALSTDLFNLRNQVRETDVSWQKMNETIRGEASAYETRQKIIKALQGELASVQDLQRAKVAMTRIDEEIAASTESREARKAQAIKNANSMFREGEDNLKEAYVAQTMRDFDTNIMLKESKNKNLKPQWL